MSDLSSIKFLLTVNISISLAILQYGNNFIRGKNYRCLSQSELYNKVTINLNGISKSALILAEIEISRCMCSLIEESIFGV